MKKFVFSLENVLGYKKESLDLLQNEMSRIQSAIHGMEEEIDGLKRKYSALNGTFADRMQIGLQSCDIAVYKRYFTELDGKTRKLELQKAEAQKAAAAKREEIVHMKGDISGLEKLRENQWKVYQAQDRKEQEREIEEFVARSKSAAGYRMA